MDQLRHPLLYEYQYKSSRFVLIFRIRLSLGLLREALRVSAVFNLRHQFYTRPSATLVICMNGCSKQSWKSYYIWNLSDE